MKRFFLTLTVIVIPYFSCIGNYSKIIEMLNYGGKIEDTATYNECADIVNNDINADNALLPYIYILLGEYNLQLGDCNGAHQCFYEALSFHKNIFHSDPPLMLAFPEVMQEYFKKNVTHKKRGEAMKKAIKECLKQVYNIQ